MEQTYDVVVVGGGAAGLSGALALGRARRSVLVVDAGDPRNAAAGHVHNYLGREGTPPGELLAIGRAEAAGYGVLVETGKVATATAGPTDPGPNHPGPNHAGPNHAGPTEPSFDVRLEDGRQVHARRLLVTTGLTDDLPDVPGLADAWGRTVLHCPYCHGWEVRDQAIGVLGTSAFGLHQALLFRQWTADLTFFLHTAPMPTADEREQLDARRIAVVEGLVAAWEEGGVRMQSGELVPRAVLVVAPVFTARAAVLESLGLQTTPVEMGGEVFGTRLAADPTGLTAVPGVWVAGNVADPRAQVIGAAATGLTAGAAINADLVAEDTRQAVERSRFFSQAAWEERYRSHPSAIWSGRPNAVLVAETADLTPGHALDVGCGEGADALWLAERGWQVTGVDISTVALARAEAEAASRGVDIDWVQADLLVDPPSADAFDLVTAHFMHLPPAERESLYARLAAAVAPGGTLLLVAHHPSDMHTTMGRPALHGMFFTAEQLAAHLQAELWDILLTEARPRTAIDPQGKTITIRDTVLRAQRKTGH